MKQFQGRVICPGTCEAEALVSHGGFNTLASYQMALMFHVNFCVRNGNRWNLTVIDTDRFD